MVLFRIQLVAYVVVQWFQCAYCGIVLACQCVVIAVLRSMILFMLIMDSLLEVFVILIVIIVIICYWWNYCIIHVIVLMMTIVVVIINWLLLLFIVMTLQYYSVLLWYWLTDIMWRYSGIVVVIHFVICCYVDEYWYVRDIDDHLLFVVVIDVAYCGTFNWLLL